jgi:hypothetical protein
VGRLGRAFPTTTAKTFRVGRVGRTFPTTTAKTSRGRSHPACVSHHEDGNVRAAGCATGRRPTCRVCQIALTRRVEQREEHIGSQSKLGAAGALPVWLIRCGGGKSGLNFSSYDRALRLRVEHQTLDLGCAQSNDSAGHLLTRLGLQVLAGWNRLGVV